VLKAVAEPEVCAACSPVLIGALQPRSEVKLKRFLFKPTSEPSANINLISAITTGPSFSILVASTRA
jgi:hypothetical protein